MGIKQQKTPSDRDQAEQPTLFAQTNFAGQVSGVPLSEITDPNVYRHVNSIGYNKSWRGRPGTRRYSKAVIPNEGTFTANVGLDQLLINLPATGHNFLNGDKIMFNTTGTLPPPFDPVTTYFAIYVSDVAIQVATTYDNAILGVAIVITGVGTGTHNVRYAADIGAILDHKKEAKVVKLYGRRAYVAEKILDSYQQVINMESVVPTGIGRLIENDSNATLAAGPIFRIVLDGVFYYMYRLNATVPNVIITDIVETPLLPFIYRYYYACARIEGTGNRNRVTDGAILVLETGTCKDENQEKPFGELSFETAIGDASNHIIEMLTLPIADQSISHFPLYRTKNIGSSSGGETNNKAYYVWAEDVPVCKAMSITVAGNLATIVVGQNEFVIGDVGCSLRVDSAGTREGVIEAYVDANNVFLAAGSTLGAAENVAIGEGRVMTASQVGYLITRTAGNFFFKTDEGRTVYWGDGGESVIRRFIDGSNVEAAVDATHGAMAATIQMDVGVYAFRRRWNDTVKDDGDAFGEIGLHERQLSQETLYIPLFNYRPIPNSDIVITDSGFSIFANRDDVEYWYSNVGNKEYSEGQFRLEQQLEKLTDPIREIKVMPAMAIILCPTKTYNLSLNVPINNVGNAAVGEYIQKLTPPSEVDGDIGVIHWQTLKKVNASLFIALTNEPAIRLFNGQSWGAENLAIEPNGDEAAMKDLNKIDAYYNIVGWYSYLGGYKLRASRWEAV